MTWKLLIMSALLVLMLAGGSVAAPKVDSILEQIDFIMALESDGTAKVEITQEIAGEGVKVYESIYYRRDADDAFLIVMTAPEVERGNGYLRSGDNFWMYRRNTRTFQHINRDQTIAGTNSSGEDFENSKLTDLYKPALDSSGNEIIVETVLGKTPVYRFELTAKTDSVTYPKQIMYVRRADYLPLKVESYALNGTLMISAYYLNYTKVQDKYMWVKALFVDEFAPGNKSLVEIKNISLQKIDDHVFTRAYLENLSR